MQIPGFTAENSMHATTRTNGSKNAAIQHQFGITAQLPIGKFGGGGVVTINKGEQQCEPSCHWVLDGAWPKLICSTVCY